MKFSALVLAIALLFNNAGSALQALAPSESPSALSPEQKRVAKAKAEVVRRGVGKKSRIRVKLRDKIELRGYISQTNADSFEMQVDPDWLEAHPANDERVTIAYTDVEKVRGPRSRAVSTATYAGLVVAGVALLAVIVALEVLKHRHDY